MIAITAAVMQQEGCPPLHCTKDTNSVPCKVTSVQIAWLKICILFAPQQEENTAVCWLRSLCMHTHTFEVFPTCGEAVWICVLMYATKRIEGHHGRGLGERQDACAFISVLQCTASQHTTEGRMSEHTSLSQIPFLLSSQFSHSCSFMFLFSEALNLFPCC